MVRLGNRRRRVQFGNLCHVAARSARPSSTTITTPAIHVTQIAPRPAARRRARRGRETTRARSPRRRSHAAAVRRVTVGTLPLNVVTLSDGSLVVTNNGNAEHGLMGVDPARATVTWTRPLRAAWLGLATSGPAGADPIWASGGGSNRL